MFTWEDACRSSLSRSTNKILPVEERPYCSHAGLRSGPMYFEARGIFAINLTVGCWPPGHAPAASIGLGGESDFKEEKAFGWSTQSFVFFELLKKRGFIDWDGSPVPLFYLCVWFKFYVKPLKSSTSVLQLLWHSHTSDPSKQTPAIQVSSQTYQVRFPNASYCYHPTSGSYGNQLSPWLPKQLCQKSENILQLSSYRNWNLPAVLSRFRLGQS